MRSSNYIVTSSLANPRTLVSILLLSVIALLAFTPAAHAYYAPGNIIPPTRILCPTNSAGVQMPAGATFTDQYGNTWVAPSGSDGGGTESDTFGVWVSFFFVGPQTSVPTPMQNGFGGIYGTYDGQQGWIVTDFCQTIRIIV